MIDKQTGAITLAEGCVIRPEMPKAEFAVWWESAPCRELHGPDTNVYLGSSYRARFNLPHSPPLVLTADFQDDQILRISLFYLLPREEEAGSPTAEWTDANEHQRKTLHDAILAEMLGDPPYSYPWGRVLSAYDSKAGFSEIRIVHHPPT